MDLKTQQQLNSSTVVANNRMNRERGLVGVNSYAKDLRFDILGFLQDCIERNGRVAWLDLCCGKGYALQQAAQLCFSENSLFHGIDLVGDFLPCSRCYFQTGSIPKDLPVDHRYDLITCVHGLHYIADKLSVISSVTRNLEEDGIFIGNLDHRNIKDKSGKTLRGIIKQLSQPPSRYSNFVLQLSAQSNVVFPYVFQGADDQAGPNYTKQPVVDSYYSTK